MGGLGTEVSQRPREPPVLLSLSLGAGFSHGDGLHCRPGRFNGVLWFGNGKHPIVNGLHPIFAI